MLVRLVVPTSRKAAPERAMISGMRKPSPISINSPRETMASPPAAQKTVLSSDRRLQLACVKLESLVMPYQNDGVNTFPGLVHTARHITKVDCTRSPNLTGPRYDS